MIRQCKSVGIQYTLVRWAHKNSLRRPESQGLICAAVYILFLILFIPFAFSDVIVNFHTQQVNKPQEGLVVTEFPHHKVSASH